MKIWFYLWVIFLLAGCQSLPDQPSGVSGDIGITTDAETADLPTPVSPQARQPVIPTGSLFNPRYGSLMVSDRRAYRLGDILTVELKGTTNISMGGASNVSKNAAISIPDPTLLGQSSAAILGGGRSLAFDLQPAREYGGNTSASRNNKLEGSVAVKVIAVLENGTLKIKGDKWLTINSGREQIRISGLVRPEDISTDNKVSSERLAEAKVDYIAMGGNADAHKPGWFTRVLNSPYFPF